ncbi:hypothetical protein SEA_WEISS13_86 [Mycobacterium phage Weiss13]|uniref:Uncharacterized protein n=2 Tax=Papyrusvirus send513 TaxID=1982556 RepID=A0A0Y0AA88_9CAUD|nr:hypothetical protein SEA_WEISS13_86 [Mycobacterium phage Weiss13]AVO21486.1 hypothetical protein PBI_NILO_89 [Mycobacterium phage Nilo]
MSNRITRDHSYKFTVYGDPSVDELVAELQRAKESVSPNGEQNTVAIQRHNAMDQRDQSYVTITVRRG